MKARKKQAPRNNALLRVLTAIYCEPWLITPAMHRTIAEIARGHSFSAEQQHAIAEGMEPNPAAREYEVREGVAVIPVDGIIGRKFSSMLYDSGVTSVDVLGSLILDAALNQDVQAIMLNIDSPGGIATGVPEAAAAIRAARERKPVLAYADGLMDSAAYWLGSQAHAVYATESADVGSIGAYIAVLDESRAAEIEGVRVEMFKSGRNKGMGFPGTSLNDEQRAMLQASVDEVGGKFRAAVRAQRPHVPAEAMEGASYGVEDAQRLGLIDTVTDGDTALRDALALRKYRGRE